MCFIFKLYKMHFSGINSWWCCLKKKISKQLFFFHFFFFFLILMTVYQIVSMLWNVLNNKRFLLRFYCKSDTCIFRNFKSKKNQKGWIPKYTPTECFAMFIEWRLATKTVHEVIIDAFVNKACNYRDTRALADGMPIAKPLPGGPLHFARHKPTQTRALLKHRLDWGWKIGAGLGWEGKYYVIKKTLQKFSPAFGRGEAGPHSGTRPPAGLEKLAGTPPPPLGGVPAAKQSSDANTFVDRENALS